MNCRNPVIGNNRVCNKCNVNHSLDMYYEKHGPRVKTANARYSSTCKLCDRHRSRQGRLYRLKNDPNYQRKADLRFTHKMSLEEYNQFLKKQNNKCAICKRHESEFKRNLAVDHNHITAKFRGLLCNSCNLGIGNLLADSGPQTLLNALLYILRHTSGQ